MNSPTITATSTHFLDALSRGNDEGAWAVLDERYRPVVRGFVTRMGLRPEDAADAAQQTMADVFGAIREGRHGRRPISCCLPRRGGCLRPGGLYRGHAQWNHSGVDVAQLARVYPWDPKYVVYSRAAGDLRGWFDYATLSTNDLDHVERFAILVCSDRAGSAIFEASPPAR